MSEKRKFWKMRKFWAAIGVVVGIATGASPALMPVVVEGVCVIAECE